MPVCQCWWALLRSDSQAYAQAALFLWCPVVWERPVDIQYNIRPTLNDVQLWRELSHADGGSELPPLSETFLWPPQTPPPPGNFSSRSIQPLVPSMLNSTFSSIQVPTNPFHITFEKKIIELWCRESKQDCLCKRLFSHKPLQPSLFFSSQWVWGHKSYRASTIQLSRNNGGLVKVSAGWRW